MGCRNRTGPIERKRLRHMQSERAKIMPYSRPPPANALTCLTIPKPASLRSALERYVDPYLGESLGAAGAVRERELARRGLRVRDRLGFPVGGYQAELDGGSARSTCARGHH